MLDPVSVDARSRRVPRHRAGARVVGRDRAAVGEVQEVVQAEGIVEAQADTRLLAPGAFAALVVGRGSHAPAACRRVLDRDDAAAGFLAGQQFQGRVVRRQAVDLFQAHLEVAQVQRLAGQAGEGPVQQDAVLAAILEDDVFEPAFDHQHRQGAGRRILLADVGARADLAARDVVGHDVRQQLLDIVDAEAASGIGRADPGARVVGQVGRGVDAQGAHVHAAGTGPARRGGLRGNVDLQRTAAVVERLLQLGALALVLLALDTAGIAARFRQLGGALGKGVRRAGYQGGKRGGGAAHGRSGKRHGQGWIRNGERPAPRSAHETAGCKGAVRLSTGQKRPCNS